MFGWKVAKFLALCLWLGSVASAAAIRHVDLNVLYFDGTAWNETVIDQRLALVNRVFATCSVQLGLVTKQKISAPGGQLNIYRDLDVKGPGGLVFTANSLGVTNHLTLIYIRQFQEGVAGTAGTAGMAQRLPALVNRAWVTEEVLSSFYIRDRDPEYVPEAHELTHILLNVGHVSGRRNLMANSPSLVSGELDSQQCAALRQSAFTY